VRKFISQLLTVERKEDCLSVASDLFECAKVNKNFFENIVNLFQNYEHLER
jgi:hypothetical protein